MCAMALVAMPQHLEANVLKHVRGCFRSSVQKWITEPKCELRPSKKHGFGLHYGEDYWIKKAEWEAKLSSTVVELNSMD